MRDSGPTRPSPSINVLRDLAYDQSKAEPNLSDPSSWNLDQPNSNRGSRCEPWLNSAPAAVPHFEVTDSALRLSRVFCQKSLSLFRYWDNFVR